MYGEPSVKVRDRQTGHVYLVSEARFKRTPHLWDRIGSEPPKPHTTVAKQAARNKKPAASHAANPQPDAPAPGEKADVPADTKE